MLKTGQNFRKSKRKNRKPQRKKAMNRKRRETQNNTDSTSYILSGLLRTNGHVTLYFPFQLPSTQL